jgi:hypothetical protein
MNHPLHLSDLQSAITNRNQLRLGGWAMGLVTLLCLGGIPQATKTVNQITRNGDGAPVLVRASAPDYWLRAGISGLGLALGIAAQASLTKARRLSAQLGDLQDIADDARQATFYRALQPANARLEVDGLDAVELLPLFDWSDLVDPDKYPTICFFAPMGGGKSTLMQWVAKHVVGAQSGKVFDPHCNEWGPWLEVVTDGKAIYQAMAADLDLVDELRRLPAADKKALAQQVRILDEAPDTLAEVKLLDSRDQQVVPRWTTKMTTFVRKLRIRTLVGAVTIAADDLGISASKRNTMTVIFPGVAGIELAASDRTFYCLGTKENRDLRNQLLESLKGVKRPALVYCRGNWFPAEVPELTEDGDPVGGMAIAARPSSGLTTDRQRLNRLFYGGDAVEPEFESGELEFVLSPRAEQLLGYLARRAPSTKRKLIQNWGRNHGADAIEVGDLLSELESAGLIEIEGDEISLAD